MKKSLLKFLLAILLFVGWQSSFGQVLLNENFNYGATAGDLTSLTTNWTGFSGTTKVAYAATSLSMPTYASTDIGGSATYTASNSEDINTSFTAQSTGTFYTSFLLKASNTSTSGGYFIILGNGTSFGPRLFCKQGPSGSGNILFGIGMSSTAVYGTTEFDDTQTYLVVIKYDFVDGATNDVASVYILNAATNSVPATPEATSTGATDQSQLNTFIIRQASGIGSGTIDGIRIAQTWTEAAGIDATAPAATFNPTNTATDISLTSNVVIAFDDYIRNTDNSEITDLSSLIIFKETDGSGADVAHTATINSTKDTITLDPTSDLKSNQVYYVSIGAVEDVNNNATTGENITFTTSSIKPEPTNHVTGFAAAPLSFMQVDLSWTDAVAGAQAPDAYLIIASTGAITPPVDGTDPAEDTDLSDGNAIVKVLNDGTQAYTFTGLSAGTTYNFQICSYTNDGSAINFKADGPTANATTATTELFFSEYIEGSTSGNTALEIYNPTGGNVNLSNYKILGSYNGGGWAETNSIVLPNIDLAAGEVYVFTRSDAAQELLDAADSIVNNGGGAGQTYVMGFTGDDARALAVTGDGGTTWNIVDIIGVGTSDPGTGWDVAGVTTATANHTLLRKAGKSIGNTDWTNSAGTDEGNSEWIVMPVDYFNNIGAYRDVEKDTSLATLTLDIGTLSPAFDPDVVNYTVELPFKTTTIPTVSATVNGTYATRVITQATSIIATEAERTATVTVTADDLGEKTYTIIFSVAKGTDNDITSFIFTSFDPDVAGTIDAGAHTVNVTVPYGTTDVTALIPTIVVSDSATINPASGVAQDFTNPVNYTVTAENGTAQVWEVTVTVAKNNQNDITGFVFAGLTPNVNGTIDAVNHTVTATVPYGTSVTALVPTISVSPDATISPLSGVAQDFSAPVNYTVTAEDLTEQVWVVTVNVASNDAKEITSFSFEALSVDGTIDEGNSTITLDVPFGTNVTALVATYATTGASVKVGTTNQVSGTTPNDFTSPVVYTVVAADASERNYTVTVNILPANTDATLSSLNVSQGTLTPAFNTTTTAYTVELPFGTTTEPTVSAQATDPNADVNITQATDVQGELAARTATVLVTAEDNSTTKTYTVVFSVNPGNNDATLSDLTVDGTTVTGFNSATLTYDVVLPIGTTAEPVVAATTNDPNATHSITQATDVEGDLAARTATVVVTAENETTTKTYTIVFSVTAVTGDLIISEYIEGGTGNNKAIELYNPNTTDVDLSQYVIKQSYNGEGWGIRSSVADSRYVLPLSGTLAAGEVYVISPSDATYTEIINNTDIALTYNSTANGADGSNVASFNGNDAIGLFKNGVLIDVVGIELAANGAGPWNVGDTTEATANHTLMRKHGITAGNTDWATSAGTNNSNSEWIIFEDAFVSNIGFISIQAPTITNITINPTTPTSADNVIVSATIADGDTETSNLTVGLFYGSAEGSETTEVTFTETATAGVFEGTIPASASNVYYKITASDGELTTSSTGNYSITTGINNPDGIVSMNLFPNPSNGNFTLEMNTSKAGTFNVEIINIQGQVVYQKQITQDGFYRENINISNNAKGIYYVRIMDGREMKVSKLIIQ